MFSLCFVDIILGNIKVPHVEIKLQIMNMDDENLTVDNIEQLLPYLQEREQMDKLVALKADYESLSKPEQFLIVVNVLTLSNSLSIWFISWLWSSC